jgi:XRE family aerobic/anaerobic benzoate catabolism transcriptional regulator
MEELRTILSSREPLYGLADAQLDTSGRAVGECAIELSAAIRERFPGKKQAALS